MIGQRHLHSPTAWPQHPGVAAVGLQRAVHRVVELGERPLLIQAVRLGEEPLHQGPAKRSGLANMVSGSGCPIETSCLGVGVLKKGLQWHFLLGFNGT